MKAEHFLKLVIFFWFISVLPGNQNTLWDFGVIIHDTQLIVHDQDKILSPNSEIKALISDPFISPKKSTQMQFKSPIEKIDPIAYINETVFIEVNNYLKRQILQKKFNHIILMLENSDLTQLSYAKQAVIQFWLATSLVETGQPQKALPFALNLLAIREADRDFMLAAKIYEKSGDKYNALQMYQKLMSQFPHSDYFQSAKIKSRIISRS